MCAKNADIIMEPVRSGEIEELLGLYADLFCDREPLTRFFGLDRDRMMEVARSMYSGSAAHSPAQWLCWIARDRVAAGRAAGFIVCDAPAEGENHEIPENLSDQEQEKASFLMAVMEAVREPVQKRIGLQAEPCLHIAALGVAPEYEGKGIATRLLQTALSGAVDRGFAHAFAECTGMASRRCHEKNGFRNLHCVDVRNVSVNGAYPFADSEINVCLLWKNFS